MNLTIDTNDVVEISVGAELYQIMPWNGRPSFWIRRGPDWSFVMYLSGTVPPSIKLTA